MIIKERRLKNKKKKRTFKKKSFTAVSSVIEIKPF